MSDETDKHLNLEEDFLSLDRKFEKKYKKAVTAKDRSKYKKTDQDKLKKRKHHQNPEDLENLKKGRVLEIGQDGILIDFQDSQLLCTLKGSLKKERTRKKNLIAVGDFVYFDLLDSETGVITSISDRFSTLSREDNLRRRKEQIIAANIDQIFITMSVFSPRLKPALIDRYIISAKKGGMLPVIVLNKIDLLNSPPEGFSKEQIADELEKYKQFKEVYSQIGSPYLELCALKTTGLKKLKELMKGKASVFSGQSGVGKTSLINAIFNTDFVTKSIVRKTHKGAHTTTSAKLIPIEGHGFCIDTPGIKSFGVWELSTSDLHSHFREFHKYEAKCKYPNCSHIHEPDCAVKEALENNLISELRYNSYCDLLESIHEKKSY